MLVEGNPFSVFFEQSNRYNFDPKQSLGRSQLLTQLPAMILAQVEDWGS